MASESSETLRKPGDGKAPPSSERPPVEHSLPENLLRQMETALNRVAGTEKLEGVSLGEMFSETFKHRTVEEMESYLIVGTTRTTPPISEVQSGWPKPWLFARCLMVFGLTYLGFVLAFEQFGTLDVVPGLLIMADSAPTFSPHAIRRASSSSEFVVRQWTGTYLDE